MNYFLSLLILTCFLSAPDTCSAQQALLPVDFSKAISTGDVQVLDVRTATEYAAGHLDSVFLADWNKRSEFTSRVSSLDKSKPVYVYCLSGVRSGQAAVWLQENGFTTYTLSGGFNAWKKEGLPVANEVMVPQVSLMEFTDGLPKDGVALVDIGADWCPPCAKMQPVLDSLVKADGKRFQLINVNGAQQVELSKALAVDAFPTFIIYKNGKETWRKQGITDAGEFTSRF